VIASTRRSARLLLILLFASSCECRGRRVPKEHRSTPSQASIDAGTAVSAVSVSTGPWLESAWDPKTGRGTVTHHLPGAGRMQTGFHIDYPGYTGGLVIGGYSSSGLAWVPERPKPGFPTINVFCAQDESIWDRDERREYTYGWAENFGTGPDGQRLEYVSGRIVEANRERVVLESENAGGCYRVRKIASTWATTQFWVIATRVTNRCDHVVHFDFFSGDDPWIGLYKSSDGDVGWTPLGQVRNEQRFELGTFTSGGLWDRGNPAIGQTEGTFSNQANFFALDPTLPLPDEASFANRFAHGKSDVFPTKPLDNQSMTALNLGWSKQTLAPAAARDYAFALGLALTSDDRDTPGVPEIRDEHWSRWRKLLPPKPGDVGENAEFLAELVELDLSAHDVQVRGTYYVHNPTTAGAAFTIGFPINVTPERPPPPSVTVDGRQADLIVESPRRISARFSISIAAQSIRSFEVRYTQPHQGRSAEYIVTSALSWRKPIDRAVFRIKAPAALGPLRTSYLPQIRQTDNGQQVLTIVRQPFVPDRELTVQW